MKNYYEILEVDKNASNEIIKAVYKIHIKKRHPDLFQGEEKIRAEEELKKINEAYETLSNERRRAEYDKIITEEERVNKEIMDDIIKENTILKEMLDNKEEHESDSVAENIKQRVPFEYQPDPYFTQQNNTKYLMKLIWRERILRLIIFLTILIAVAAGLYKLTGENVLSIIWKSFIRVFGGNN